jgi:hypothetical protein
MLNWRIWNLITVFLYRAELLNTDRRLEGNRRSPALKNSLLACQKEKTPVCSARRGRYFYAYPKGLRTRWDLVRTCCTSVYSCGCRVPWGLSTWNICSQRTCVSWGRLVSRASDSSCLCTWYKSCSPSLSWRLSGGLACSINKISVSFCLKAVCSVVSM